MLANLRLVLDVEVRPAISTLQSCCRRDCGRCLIALGRDRWPQMLRGDAGVASDALMRECEQRGLPYLFKLARDK